MRSYVRQRGALAGTVADCLQTGCTSAAALALRLQTVRGYADCRFCCTTLLLHSNVIALRGTHELRPVLQPRAP